MGGLLQLLSILSHYRLEGSRLLGELKVGLLELHLLWGQGRERELLWRGQGHPSLLPGMGLQQGVDTELGGRGAGVGGRGVGG